MLLDVLFKENVSEFLREIKYLRTYSLYYCIITTAIFFDKNPYIINNNNNDDNDDDDDNINMNAYLHYTVHIRITYYTHIYVLYIMHNGNLSQVQIVWKMTAKLIMAIDYYITKWF